jgi:hypothetical protein
VATVAFHDDPLHDAGLSDTRGRSRCRGDASIPRLAAVLAYLVGVGIRPSERRHSPAGRCPLRDRILFGSALTDLGLGDNWLRKVLHHNAGGLLTRTR